MAYVIEIPDYLAMENNVAHEVEAGQTVLDWLNKNNFELIISHNRSGKWVCFELPTVVQINGDPILQEDYGDTVIESDDFVTMTIVLGDPVSIIVAVVVSVLAVGATLLFAPRPPSIQDTPEAEATFSLRSQNNAIRRGEPIPSSYGTVKNWPDFAALPYSRYEGNRQFQFSLFCLGHGSYEVSEPQLADTPIEDFVDVEIEIYQPGETVDLFRDAVINVDEVANITLFGSNEDSYDGISGPFVMNDVETQINRIEVDLAFSQGLFENMAEGELGEATIRWVIEYRLINDEGDSIGSWQTLTDETFSLATNTPQRYTRAANVPFGRYQIRGRRGNRADTGTLIIDTLVWEAARGFLENVGDYGDVTLIAMRALATNNLNDSTNSEFSVRQTRIGGTDPLAAFRDIFTARYGGNFDDSFVDTSGASTEGFAFNYTFSNAVSIWEAGKLALSAMRSVPMLNGSRLGVIQDVAESLPQHFFAEQNMIKDSFEWQITFRRRDDFDGLMIRFVDEVTWNIRSLLCTVGDEEGENPDTLMLDGITDPDQAFQQGLYLRAKNVYGNETFSFTTGLEGYIPPVNALVGISHNITNFGISGKVVSREGGLFKLSREVTMEAGKVYQVAFTSRRGESLGPYQVTNTEDTTDELIVAGTLPPQSEFERSQFEELPIFLFGEITNVVKLARITSITPGTNNTVDFICVNNDDRIYGFDEAVAPLRSVNENAIVDSAIPIVPSINAIELLNQPGKIQVSWGIAQSASTYILEVSYDGIEFNTLIVTASTSHAFEPESSVVHLRVAGINSGIGPFVNTTISIEVAITSTPEPVSGLVLLMPFTGNNIVTQWNESMLAENYIFQVLDGSGVVVSETVVTNTLFTYTAAKARVDFNGSPERDLSVRVIASNSLGDAPVIEALNLLNPPPSPPTNITAVAGSNDGFVASVTASWDASVEEDFKEFVVYASDTSGFIPGDDTEVARLTGNTATFDMSVINSPNSIFYIVKTIDNWGEHDNGLSTEQELIL